MRFPSIDIGRLGACMLLAWTALTAHAFAPDEIPAASLPREGRVVLAAVRAGGPFAYPKDGVTFGNYEKRLPARRRGFYREYTVATPGERTRGARRIVCGGEAAEWARNAPQACWYTADHYASFRRIVE